MAARATLTALGSALVLSALAAGGARAQTSVSVYADGRVVVRRALPQPLEKGRNSVVLKEAIDPATIFSPDTAVALVAAQARGVTTQQRPWRGRAARRWRSRARRIRSGPRS